MKVSIWTMIAAAAVLAIMPGQASQADHLNDLLRGYSRYDAGTPALSAHQQATLNNLINTETKIRTDINAGLRSGQISSAVAADMLHDLDEIASVRLQYSAGSLSFAEAQMLASRLGTLDARVSSQLASGSGAVVPLPGTGDFDNRIAALETRISNELRNGRVNRWQADKLRSDLENIEADLDDMRANGGLSAWEREQLTSDLNALSSRLDRLANAGNMGPSVGSLRAKVAQLRNKLQDALENDDLSPYQARKFRFELASVSRQLSGGSGDQALLRSLSQRLNGIDRRLTYEIRVASREDNWN